MNKAYLAGLVDGEGYFGLIPIRKKESTNTTYQCVVKLCLAGLNAEKVIKLIADNYKGHLYKRNKNTATGKEVFSVEIKSKPRVKALLDDIQPYLLVKKEQAELMREYIDLPVINPLYGSFTQELFDKRLEIAKRMKSYTQRIPVATTK